MVMARRGASGTPLAEHWPVAGSYSMRRFPRHRAGGHATSLGHMLLLAGAALLAVLWCSPCGCAWMRASSDDSRRPPARPRRHALAQLPLLSLLTLAPGSARSEQTQIVIGGAAPPQDLLLISPYSAKVQRLRSVVRESGELVNLLSTQVVGGGLMGGSVDAVRERMEQGKKEVLLPLQRDLAGAVERLAPTLAGAERQRLEALPGLLQGHFLELDDALGKGLMAEYTGKDGQAYKCGKVERELEEVGETVDEFLKLAGQGAPPSTSPGR